MSQISIVIPVYNAGKYLENCIKSILRQSFQNYEVILIDDGSTDESGKICDHYAGKESHIRVIHTSNKGPAAARKTGVRAARGEYITFVDADDWLETEMLSFMIEKAELHQAQIVCLGHKEVDADGRVLSCTSQETELLEMTSAIQMMHHLHGTRLIDSGPWAKLIDRSCFESVDFCESVTIGEDYFMVLQLLEKADKVVFCKDPLYDRCIRKTSISRSGYSDRHKRAFEQYMKWRIYLLERYPELRTEIIGYHTEYELAVITAMCRNRKYDRVVIGCLVRDLRKNRKIIWQCAKTPLHIRSSAMLIAYCYPIFIVIFRGIHLLTGR